MVEFVGSAGVGRTTCGRNSRNWPAEEIRAVPIRVCDAHPFVASMPGSPLRFDDKPRYDAFYRPKCVVGVAQALAVLHSPFF